MLELCCVAQGGMLKATVGSVEEKDEEQEDEGEEELRDGGVPFYVNRRGLPVDEETWERMWRHVARIHPNGEALAKEIRGATDLPKVQINPTERVIVIAVGIHLNSTVSNNI